MDWNWHRRALYIEQQRTTGFQDTNRELHTGFQDTRIPGCVALHRDEGSSAYKPLGQQVQKPRYFSGSKYTPKKACFYNRVLIPNLGL